MALSYSLSINPKRLMNIEKKYNRIWPWIPIIIIFLTIIVFWVADLKGYYESPTLVFVLDLFTKAFAGVAVMFLVGRSFLKTSEPGLLLFGCAVGVWSTTSFVYSSFLYPDSNFDVTIITIGIGISALCHFASAFFSTRSKRFFRPAKLWLTGGYFLTFVVSGLIVFLTLKNVFPIFFMDEFGGTPERYLILSFTLFVLILSVALLWRKESWKKSPFVFWYVLSLFLFTISIFGMLVQTSYFSPLNWSVIISQVLTGIYLLVTAIESIYNSGLWKISLNTEISEVIKESEERFSSLYLAMTEGVAIHELIRDEYGTPIDYKIVDVNPAYENITGLSKEKAVGSLASELYSTGEPPYFDIYKNVVFTRKPESFETYFEPMKKHFRITVVSPAKGKFATIFRDITERKIAEENTKKLISDIEQERDKVESLINSMRDEVWFVDTNKKFILANPSALRHFNLDLNEQVDVEKFASDSEVFRVDGTPRPVEETPPLRALKGEIVKNQEEIVRSPKTGELRNREVSSAPVRNSDGEIIGSVSVVHDITERKRLEGELADRIYELQENDRLKDEFIAVLAHELRNPLAPLLIASKILKQNNSCKDDDLADNKFAPEVVCESVEVVERQVKTMSKLLDDLLDVSRITHGKVKLEKEKIDISLVINDSIKMVFPFDYYSDRTISVDLPEKPVIIEADKLRVEQIITNLLNNAVKYTNSGGHIWISAYREDGKLVVKIKDDGIGIMQEKLPHIFEPFFQTDRALIKSCGGLGIGLMLSRNLARLSGGDIVALSEGAGKGSVFIFTLPI